MPMIKCGAAALRYELTGASGGPCLLLSNSLGTRLEMWDAQMDALEQHFQLLRYDMRGHGESSAPAGPYTIEMLGRDVLALLDGLGLARVHFCGLSIGGVIGQWLAANAPERIDHLLLCNTAAKIGVADTWNSRIAAVRSGGMTSIADSVLSRWFTAPFMERESATVATMRDALVKTNSDGYIASCEAIRDMDQRELARTIRTPTCIIAGAQDAVTSLEDAAALQHAIAGSRLVTLQAAHISNVETPEAFTTSALDFLLGRHIA